MSARAIDDEVAAILADPDKRISGELRWADDEDASGQEFLAAITHAGGELFVRGQRCAAAGTLRFALISRGLGRIAALDLAHDDLHFHRWSPGRRDERVPLTAAATSELHRSSPAHRDELLLTAAATSELHRSPLAPPDQPAPLTAAATSELHRSTAAHRDELLLTAAARDERSAWRLFCRLTAISHDGELAGAPPTQESLL